MPAAHFVWSVYTVPSDDAALHWIIVVLSPGFPQGTTKTFAIKTKPWRVAAPVWTAKLLAVFHRKPVKKPETRGLDNEISCNAFASVRRERSSTSCNHNVARLWWHASPSRQSKRTQSGRGSRSTSPRVCRTRHA
jgi:hypothetical protein